MEAIASADGTSHQRDPRRARSNVHSDRGSRAEIGASRWPAAVCSSRYGATSNASPPTSAAPTPRPSLSQPRVRQQPGGDEPEQHEHVPAHDDAERPPERPEGKAERPGGRVQLGLGDRAERVRVTPREPPLLDLVPGQPEAIGGLEMIPRRRLAVARLAAGEEVRVRMAQRGRRRQQRRRRADERR